MSTIIEIFNSSPITFLSFVFILSLIIGSFLNVIIFRLPGLLKAVWRQQCREFLEDRQDTQNSDEHQKLLHKLFVQNSHCLHCKKPIHYYDNIPVISYLLLRGKCRHCKKHFSIQYPCIEALSAFLGVGVAWYFGVSVQTIAGCLLTYVLLVQATIDLHHTIIPDEITLPMLWLGLLISIPSVFVNSSDAIIGAACGYLILWLIYWCFFLATNKEGMGYGDFKLLAMLGAWLGWQCLPFIILFSSILGSATGIVLITFKGSKRINRIPFGPFLAIAGFIALLFGHEINVWYLQYVGIY